MKKLLSSLLSFVLIASLAGCGGPRPTSSAAGSVGTGSGSSQEQSNSGTPATVNCEALVAYFS